MSCDCEPQKWERPLAPGGADQYAVQFEADLAQWLERRTNYALGRFLRSRLVAGYEWEVTTAGQTGIREPRLPTVLGQTVQDGSAVLTCRALSTSSLSAVLSDVNWDAPTGITVSGEAYAGQLATATFAAAANLAEGDYEVVVTAVAGAKTIPKTCVLKISRC